MNDCCSHGQMLDFEQAKLSILAQMEPHLRTERVSLEKAVGRTLAEDILSPITQPNAPTSAMDGYAVSYADLQTNRTFKVQGTSLAGHPYGEKLKPGHCVRIMTGAVVPEGADTVVMQEMTEIQGEQLQIAADINHGANIRPIGAELKKGEMMIDRGCLITPAQVALIATLGIPRIRVYKPVKIASFSTGDELQPLGKVLSTGQIYDSNRYAIRAMLTGYGFDFEDMGVIPDCPENIEKALTHAANIADVIITSGGVSVGDADYVKACLENIGSLTLWKVAMKPGKPLALGRIEKAYFFGLPGNPVSAMVTFYQLALPALLKLQGQAPLEPLTLEATAQTCFKKSAGRLEFQRGIFTNNGGKLSVHPLASQSSAQITSMHQANCFVILERDTTQVEPGETIRIQPFKGFVH